MLERNNADRKYSDPSSSGRSVMITSARGPSRLDEVERPGLSPSPFIGMTGLLPELARQEKALARYAGTYRGFSNVAMRVRQLPPQEHKVNESIETSITQRSDGGQYIEISIDNDGDEERLLAELLLETRRLRTAYGDMPSLVIVDKTGRYGLLPMILPGQLATYSLAGDLTSKKFLEFWLSLASVDQVLKSGAVAPLNKKLRYFAQMGMLAAATQPAIHFHPTECVDDEGRSKVKDVEPSVLDRLNVGEFGPEYVSKVVDEICVEKFLLLVDLIERDFLGKDLNESAPHFDSSFFGNLMESVTVFRRLAADYREKKVSLTELAQILRESVDGLLSAGNHVGIGLSALEIYFQKNKPLSDEHLQEAVAQSEEMSKTQGEYFSLLKRKLGRFSGYLNVDLDKLKTCEAWTRLVELLQVLVRESGKLKSGDLRELGGLEIELRQRENVYINGRTASGILKARRAIEALTVNTANDVADSELMAAIRDFKFFMKGDPSAGVMSCAQKKEFWAEVDSIEFPRARLVVSSAIVAALSDDLLKAVTVELNKIPEKARGRLSVRISEKFGKGFSPGLRIEGSPKDIGQYGKDIMAVFDQVLNDKWAKLFALLTDICDEREDKEKREALMRQLSEEMQLAKVMEAAVADGVTLEQIPGFSLKFKGAGAKDGFDITKAESNYLGYIVKCFDFVKSGEGRGKFHPEIHNARVCPRAIVIEATENGAFSYQVTPNVVFEPVGDVKALEAGIGDWRSLKRVDARLIKLEDGLVVKNVGGDGAVDDLFMRRDKLRHSEREGDYVFQILRDLFARINNRGTVPAFFVHYVKKETEGFDLGVESLWDRIKDVVDGLTDDQIHNIFQNKEQLPDWFLSLIDIDECHKGDLVRLVERARMRVEEKFQKADYLVPGRDELRSSIAANLSAVRVLVAGVVPSFNASNGSAFEARYLFQLALSGLYEDICKSEYVPGKDAGNICDSVDGGFVRKEGVEAVSLDKHELTLVDHFKYFALAQYIVENSLAEVLARRDMADPKNLRAKYLMIEEISHILEEMSKKWDEGELLKNIFELKDESFFRKVVGFVASKMRKRGYNDEFYFGMLKPAQKQTEGHIGLIADCAFDEGRLDSLCDLNGESVQMVRAIVRRAARSVYEMIDEKRTGEFALLDKDGVLLP